MGAFSLIVVINLLNRFAVIDMGLTRLIELNLRPVFLSVVLFVLCHLSGAIDQTLVSIVPPGMRTCFYEELVAGRTLEVEFDVFRGGNMDITFLMRDPHGQVLKHLPMKRSDYFYVEISTDGVHELCLDNLFSRMAEKVVSLEFFDNRPMDDYDTAYDDLMDDPEASSLEMKVLDIFEAIDNLRLRVMRILHYQGGRRNTEARDRYLMESTHTLVDRTSVMSLLLMVMSTAAQVYLIRAMFRTPSLRTTSYKSNSSSSPPRGVTNLFSNGIGR